MSYSQMNEMPAFGSAANTKAGNGREGFAHGSMSGQYAPGMAGGRQMQMACAFPQAPPQRAYCMPAPFSSLDGRSKFRLIDAYGNSRPVQSYY